MLHKINATQFINKELVQLAEIKSPYSNYSVAVCFTHLFDYLKDHVNNISIYKDFLQALMYDPSNSSLSNFNSDIGLVISKMNPELQKQLLAKYIKTLAIHSISCVPVESFIAFLSNPKKMVASCYIYFKVSFQNEPLVSDLFATEHLARTWLLDDFNESY